MKRCKVIITGAGGASEMGTIKSLLKVKNIKIVAGYESFGSTALLSTGKVVLLPAHKEKLSKRCGN